MPTVLIFLYNSMTVEAVKAFVLDWDDFEEANEAYDTENSGGDQWKST